MLKTETCAIDGATYAVQQLPTMRGLRLFARLARALGPAIGKLGSAVGQARKAGAAGLLEGVSDEALGAAIEALFERLSPDEFEHVVTELFWSLTRDGKVKLAPGATGSQFDLEMAGQLATILKLLKFAFEVNYGNFSAAARALVQQGAPAAAPEKP